MSREIRRVPADWQHPIDPQRPCYSDGTIGYIGLLSGSPDEALASWQEGLQQWLRGEYEYQDDSDVRTEDAYRDYTGGEPEAEHYMGHHFTGRPATHWQLYETVSEGSPVSPVFATREALIEWMKRNGCAAWAVRLLEEDGWCPSMIGIMPRSEP